MRKKKVGLFVGKFIAFHKGHEYYIQKFSAACDKLNLVLCGNTIKDRVPCSIRRKWLETDLKPGMPLSCVRNKIKLHTLVEDNIRPYPEGIKEWCREVENLIEEKIDIMFGNDDYVRECAPEFGSFYCTPDQDRGVYNISSTKILDNNLKYYDLLTDVSKPYFNKKVLLIGPESTGKSTMARKLALYFKGKYVEEYGRHFEEEMIRKGNKKATEWGIKEYEQIANWQDFLINLLMEQPIRLLFVDTDALITQLFAELYINENSPLLDKIVRKQHFDLILYLEPSNTQWVCDGLRQLHDQRDQVGELIMKKLKTLNRDFIVLKNDQGYDARLDQAKQLIQNKFNILR